MPKKVLNPDRIRMPSEWRNAWILFALSMAVGMGGPKVFLLADVGNMNPGIWRWLWPLIFALVITPSTIHFYRVKRKWTKIIRDTGGLLCPNCAYILSGSKEEGAGVTCSECGHYIEDWKGLNERWAKKVKKFK